MAIRSILATGRLRIVRAILPAPRQGGVMTSRITPCLWFDTQAEEAARFYTSIFRNSRITTINHYGDDMPMPKGTVLTVRFELDGQEFLALNGGPMYRFTEA